MRASSKWPTIRPKGADTNVPSNKIDDVQPRSCQLCMLREGLRALFVDPFRLHIPVRIRAKTAVPADEHLAGFLVAFERPQEPVRRDVGELAAAGMKVRRAVAAVVPRAIERRHVVDRFKR